MRVHLFACILSTLLLSTGCGLFGELPEFQQSDTGLGEDASGGECRQASDCDAAPNMHVECVQNTCVFECQDGFVDLEEPLGCECEIEEEICDGKDNDCDGNTDDVFAGGQIEVGRAHTCATTAAGQLFCWGNNASGQLGLGTTALQSRPKRLQAFEDRGVKKLAVGHNHTCVTDADNQLHCWGSNAFNQLGDGGSDDQLSPTLVSSESYKAISAGQTHTCAIHDNAKVFCWGDNTHGQLGNNTTDEANTPTEITDTRAFVAIAAGTSHTCALAEMETNNNQGTAYCWGSNAAGQLGVAGPSNTLEPARVDTSKAFANITAGEEMSCARTSSDDVYCWGPGGQPPQLVTDPFNEGEDGLALRDISAGATLCGVSADGTGTVYCGRGVDSRAITDFNFVDVATGPAHSCAIHKNGRLYCWGSNAYGQIGNGSTGGTVTHPRAVKCAD